MKRVFLIAAAVVLLWGCGSHDNTAEGRLHSLLAETHEKADTLLVLDQLLKLLNN